MGVPGAGNAPLTEYGRGEEITDDGGPGDNANGDVFMIDGAAYVDPPYFNPGGVCPPGARDWDNVATLPAGVMRDVATRTGMFLEVGHGQVSSCSAALIGPDLILTAAHCLEEGTEVASGSFTLDYQTDEFGNRLAGYNPKFHKLKRLVKSGWAMSSTGPGMAPGQRSRLRHHSNGDSAGRSGSFSIAYPPGPSACRRRGFPHSPSARRSQEGFTAQQRSRMCREIKLRAQ